jgi:predicted dehydrogenase
MNPLRFGLIGYGRFAERAIAPAIRATPGAALVAIQKRDPAEAARKAAELGGVTAFTDVGELVRHPEVDAVFIVSANSAHCPETLTAAAAGKHVLVEKPMAMDAGEARRMIDACVRAKVTLMVGHMVRLSPAVQRIKAIIDKGGIGRVTFARADFMYDGSNSARKWLYDRRVAGGGPVYDIGVHCLDTLRAILDDEPASVKAQLDPPPDETVTESTAQLSLRFSRGTPASIYCSFTSGIRRSFLEVIGTRGMLSLVDFTVNSRTAEVVWTQQTAEVPPVTRVEKIEVPNLYEREVALFVESVRNGRPPVLSGENGLANQLVVDAVMGGRS